MLLNFNNLEICKENNMPYNIIVVGIVYVWMIYFVAQKTSYYATNKNCQKDTNSLKSKP